MLYWFTTIGITWFGFTNCEISHDWELTCWRESEVGIVYYISFISDDGSWMPYEMKTSTCSDIYYYI